MRAAIALIPLACLGCSTEAQPVLGRCALGEPCHLLLEAEDFAGTWAEQYNLHPTSGRGVRVSNAAGIASNALSGRIDVPAGRYVVWARGWVDDRHDRRWRVELAEQALEDTHAARPDVDEGFEWQRAGEVELEAGPQPVRLVDRGDSWEAPDALLLTSVADFDPRTSSVALSAFPDDPTVAKASLDVAIARARAYAARVPEPEVSTWPARRAHVRGRVLEQIGLPEAEPRTPLNAQVHGAVAFDGYRVERVSFESRPGFVVTAHLFLPDGLGPFPAMVSPIGHYYVFGKMDHRASARAHGLAREGVATLIYDAFGQGERDRGGHGHGAHWTLRLTGRTNLTLMVWDTIRALDYLQTRPEVDPMRIGVTGASGGGLNTLYAGVFDERFAVTAPVVFVTQFDDFLESRVPHDGCSLVPGMLRFTNAGEIAGLAAPRPQLMMAAREDQFFPIEGAEAAAREAQAVYEAAGAPASFRFGAFDGGHAYGRSMREHLYGFVRHHLDGREAVTPIPEAYIDLPRQDDPALLVFESGFVPEDSETPEGLARAWAQEAVAALPGPEALDVAALRADLAAQLLEEGPRPAPRLQLLGPLEALGGAALEVAHLQVEPGLSLPVYLHRGEAGAPLVVFVDGADRVSRSPLEAAARRGWSAAHVSLRGWGELREDEFLLNSAHVVTGDPLLGARAQDLLAALEALRAVPGLSDGPVVLAALGRPAGVVGLFTQAVSSAFDAAVIGHTPEGYLTLVDRKAEEALLLQSILLKADLPHVAALAADKPLAWATDWGALEGHHPEWAAHLDARIQRLDRGDPELALDAAEAMLAD